jgi:hypothetical protein
MERSKQHLTAKCQSEFQATNQKNVETNEEFKSMGGARA